MFIQKLIDWITGGRHTREIKRLEDAKHQVAFWFAEETRLDDLAHEHLQKNQLKKAMKCMQQARHAHRRKEREIRKAVELSAETMASSRKLDQARLRIIQAIEQKLSNDKPDFLN